MFHSARLKLTAWYLAIIMLVSLTFSFIIYRNLVSEVERFEKVQRLRIERNLEERWIAPFHLPVPIASPELIEETKQRIFIRLLILNGSILFLSGVFGYVLAGKTLNPIKEMVEEQNRFISDASHELRTPLTALKSSFEVYLRDKNKTVVEADSLIKDGLEEVNNLNLLTDSLLQLAQYKKTPEKIKFEPLDTKDLLNEVVRRIEPLARQKKITLDYQVKNTKVRGNKYSLIDLFSIILDNAIKYSTKNSRITIKVEERDGFAEIVIRDQGIGISAKDLPHIFDRFYRSNTARSKSLVNGYGLGLAIAREITQIHHGSIKVLESSKKGTTFAIYLPKG
ncbi:HAMP domain-containing histidine kinase [Candidatus Microgenomates bacterium]|nr:HAMP domain-containing histidine kinase [Candidatus Microgenomates bacterium]